MHPLLLALQIDGYGGMVALSMVFRLITVFVQRFGNQKMGEIAAKLAIGIPYCWYFIFILQSHVFSVKQIFDNIRSRRYLHLVK